MRTTITLDDDVAAKIQAKVRRSGRPFKEVVNEALRAGLALENRVKQLPPFKIPPEHLITLKQGPNYDKVEEVFDELDTPSRLR
jgi:hypothetical protein